jgi:hypothetical protein
MNFKRFAAVTVLPLIATTALATGSASASTDADREVERSGSCSGSTDWKLKAKHDDSRIEVEFEVDSGISGQAWKVKIKDNGQRVFSGTRETAGASGSFSVERKVTDLAGTDRFKATATNAATGESCKGTVALS